MIAQAYLNWGRWLAKCPNCGTPNDVEPDQAAFICPVCFPGLRTWAIRMDPDGLGRPIADPVAVQAAQELATQLDQVWKIGWPADRAEIEAALRPRPVPEINWLPGQTVEDLRAANRERGIIDAI